MQQPEVVGRARRTPLYALFSANAVSVTGNVLTFLAVPWFVLQTTGSIAQTGLTAFFETAAVAVSALLGSALVDRLGYRRASVLSDLGAAACIGLIPLLTHLGLLAFWALLALVFFAGMFATPGLTARAAMVPDLTELAQARLERVNALTDGISRIARFFGASLGGILIAITVPGDLLWIDAATFVFSALVIGLGVPHIAPHAVGATDAQEGALAAEQPLGTRVRRYVLQVGAGAGFIRRDAVILSIVLTVMVTNLLDAGFASVLAPAYIKREFGNAAVLGGIVAAFGGAGFLGTLLFGAIGHRLPRQLTLGVGFTLAGAPRYVAMLLIPFAPLLIAIYAVSGFFVGPVNPLIDTVSYERIPAALRARVFGTITAGATLGTPLGGLGGGLLAVWLGLPPAILIFGAVYLVMTLSLLVNPALRGMEKSARTEPAHSRSA